MEQSDFCKKSSERIYPFLLSEFKPQIDSAIVLIEKALIADEKPAISFSKNEENFSFFISNNKTFKAKNSIEIPKIIRKIILTKKYRVAMGISLALNSVVISSDNNLVLWNFALTKFQVIREANGVILAFETLETPSHLLNQMKNAEYLVFLSTPSQIIVFALAASDSQLFVIKKKIVVEVEDSDFVTIKANKDGRVFMVNRDGEVCELDYQSRGNFIQNALIGHRKKIRRLDRGGIFEKLLIPIKSLFGSPDCFLKDIFIDEHRNFMYALSAAGALLCWEILKSGVAFVSKLSDIPQEVAKSKLSKYSDFSQQTLISLQVVSPFESRDCLLFLVTNKCARIFISMSKSKQLELLNVCELVEEPRPESLGSSYKESLLAARYGILGPSKSAYDSGNFLAAFNTADSGSLLEVVSADGSANFGAGLHGRDKAGRQDEKRREQPNRASKEDEGENASAPRSVYESVERIELSQRVLDLASLPLYLCRSDMAFYCYAPQQEIPIFGLAENSLTHLTSNRIFFVLTPKEIKIFEKQNIFSILEGIFNDQHQSEKLASFLNSFGAREACAHCLALICCDMPAVDLPYEGQIGFRKVDERTKISARSLYFTLFGGCPKPVISSKAEAEDKVAPHQEDHNKDFVQTAYSREVNFVESGRLSGLSTFISRVLRPIWRFPLVGNVRTDEFENKVPFVMYSPKVLDEILGRLKHLEEFLEKFKKLFYNPAINDSAEPSPNLQSKRDLSKCIKMEIESIEGIHKTAIRSIEALSLFIRLSTSCTFFNKIFQKLDKDKKEYFLESPFCAFLSEKEGEQALKALMTNLVDERYEDIVFLKENCPTFFTTGDAHLCNGILLLNKAAEKYPNMELAFEDFGKADEEFSDLVEVAKDGFPLEKVAAELKKAAHYAGIIKIVLKLLNEIALMKSIREIDPKPGRLAEGDCYEFAFKSFLDLLSCKEQTRQSDAKWNERLVEAQLAKMREIVIESKNRLFQFALFAFLLEKGFNHFILSFYPKSNFLSQYIFENCKEDIRAARIAFSLLLKNTQYIQGAQLARHWAVLSRGTSLEERHDLILKSQRFFRSIENPTKDEANFFLVTKHYQIRIEMQMKLLAFLETKGEEDEESLARKREQSVAELKEELFLIGRLYKTAKKFGFCELCLEIHNLNFMEDPEGTLLKDLWIFILSSEIKAALANNRDNWIELVKSVFKNFFSRFKECAESQLETIVLNLERANSENSNALKNWVVDLLFTAGISIERVVKTYLALIDQFEENPRDEPFLDKFKPNCFFTLSATKVLEQLSTRLDALSQEDPARSSLAKNGYELVRKWRRKRLRVANGAERKLRMHVDRRFNLVSVKLEDEVADGPEVIEIN